MKRKPRVLDAIVKMVVFAGTSKRRSRQQRVGRSTRYERKLYAAQRKLELPPGHPYA